MMQFGICDDEGLFRQKVKQYCEEVLPLKFYDFELKEYSCGEELLNSNDDLDLLFLDIEMGEISGIDVKRYFEDNNRDIRIVFLTNHNQMMRLAFGKNVYGFINKQNYKKEFLRIFDRVLFEIQNNEKWEVESDSKKVYINMNDIIYIEADKIYVTIITRYGRYFKRCSMKDCEAVLIKRGFFRIHNSYIINFKYFTDVTGKGVKMSNGLVLKMSRGAGRKIKEHYIEYIKSRIR